MGTLSPRELAMVGIPAALLLLAVFYAAYRVVDPAPPRKIVISTSAPGGGYERFARFYGERLARNGVDLEIRHSGGSLENLERLRDPASGIQVAFTTTGAAQPEDAASIASLGGVFYSPVFVFYRTPDPIDQFSQLNGKRISTGTSGTFVRTLAREVLRTSGALGAQTQLHDLDTDAAIDSLIAGRIDAAIFPASLDSPAVQRALSLPRVRMMSVAQADALTKRIPVLTHIVLARGLINLERDEPPRDWQLLATANSVLIRKDLHPALQYLLLEAMREAHSPPGPFHRQGDFPRVAPEDLPLSQMAERFYRSGRPWLYQYTTFWVAVLLDRLVLIMIPVVVALIPILGYAPTVYRWLHRRKLWRLHREIAELEFDLAEDAALEHREEYRVRLTDLERKVRMLTVPLPFEDEVYHLRNHLDLLRSRLTHS